MNITPLQMKKVFFTGIDPDYNSCIELHTKNKKQTIGGQALIFQGCEYHLVFENEKQCNDTMDKLFKLFNPSLDICAAKSRFRTLSDPSFEVLSKKMITPVGLLAMVQHVYPKTELVWTPTTIDVSKTILGENFDKFHDYMYSPESRQSNYGFNCIHFIHSEISHLVASDFNVFSESSHWSSLCRSFAQL